MAIVPIRDEYTDTATAGQTWRCHTPIALGNGKAVLITDKDAVQARVYTYTDTGWTRGNPLVLDIDCSTSRASAHTLERNVLLQGTSPVQHTSTVIDPDVTAILLGPSGGPDLTRLHNTESNATFHAQSFRVAASVTTNHLTFYTYNSVASDTAPSPQVLVQIATNPDGTGGLATTSTTINRNAGLHTVTLVATLAPFTDYYLVFGDALNFDPNRLGETASLTTTGSVATAFTNTRYDDGLPIVPGYGSSVWFKLTTPGATHTVTTTVQRNGYQVLGVSGSTLSLHPPTTLADGPDDLGDMVTAPDGMVRVAATNRFFAWRNYPHAPEGGVLVIDLLEVKGTAVTVVASYGGISEVGDVGYTQASTPHQIIPISATEAMAVLSYPDKLQLVHVQLVGSSTLALFNQTITGYPFADGATLVPGYAHTAELIIQAAANDPVKLIRLGIDWANGAFSIDTLPITNYPKGIKPDGYSPKSANAHLALTAGSAAITLGGAILVVARQFIDVGHDDNWILFTEYDQTDGTIVAQTWAKGDITGSAKDLLYSSGPALDWDSTAERLIFADTEVYRENGAAIAQPARLGLYRINYTLDAAARSSRQSFER